MRSFRLNESVDNHIAFFRKELDEEYRSILDYWITHAPDPVHGGFYGKIDNNNLVDPKAPKGSVLNARILWSFAAAYRLLGDVRYLIMADRAFAYLSAQFADKTYGGVYWTVDYTGAPLETKKQVYAQAFAIYALSEFYQASGNEEALRAAKELYVLLERYSLDTHGGYLEAFARNWSPIADLRLSEKDANEKKTMNTHLHVLEAYTNLFRVWPDEQLRKQIAALLEIFEQKIIDPHSSHLQLFFDEHWNVKGSIISFGHDIEASWLLLEAAEALEDITLINRFKSVALQMANATLAGMDTDGGLWYESDPLANEWIKEKHWWPQAEALVGFINAWQLSGDGRYFDVALKNWLFITRHILNKENGEWYWGVKEDYSVMTEDKAGLWKCPYHNSRACMELLQRL